MTPESKRTDAGVSSMGMKVYLIWDNRNQEFFKAGAKAAWISKGAAKNAVFSKIGSSICRANYHGKYHKNELSDDWLDSAEWNRRYLSFADQTRFECREYEIGNSEYKTV